SPRLEYQRFFVRHPLRVVSRPVPGPFRPNYRPDSGSNHRPSAEQGTAPYCRNPFVCGQLLSSNPVAAFAVGDRYPIQLSPAPSSSAAPALDYREKTIRELFLAATAPFLAGLR